jgi:hypothetical protein
MANFGNSVKYSYLSKSIGSPMVVSLVHDSLTPNSSKTHILKEDFAFILEREKAKKNRHGRLKG